MKSNICERASAARTSASMQHRRPARQRAQIQQPVGVKPAGDYFEAIVQSSDDAIIGKTLTGLVISWNRGAERIFGYTEKEMIGRPMLRVFPIERLDEEYYILEKIVAGELVSHFETVRIHKNGAPVHVSVSISLMRDRDGNIIGASTIARDISDKLALENTAEQFRTLVDSSDDAIIAKDMLSHISS